MPFARNSELPANVRNSLPGEAQTLWRRVFNSQEGRGLSDQRSAMSAWSTLRSQGWRPPPASAAPGAKWRRTSKRAKNAPMGDVFTLKTEIAKVNDELGLVMGFAIVCTEDGEPYFDLQGDHIPEDAMLKAATDFALNSRIAGDMHERDDDGATVVSGTVVHTFPLTSDVAEAFGIVTRKTGLMIAMKPSDRAVLQKFKDGTYTGFSIGGERIEDEDLAEEEAA